MRDEHADQHRNRARHRIAGPLEQRLARGKRCGKVAAAPGVCQLVTRNLGAAGCEQFDLARADRLARRPRGDLVHLARELLGIVTDDLDQKPRRLRIDADLAVGELLRHPLRQPALGDVVDEHVSRLRACFRERGILLQFRRDQRQHRSRSGIGEVGGHAFRVGRLPTIDLFDDHEPAVATEQAERVARGDHVIAARVDGREQLRRFLADAIAQAPERALDLRPVAAGDQVDRLELARHRGAA